MVARIGRLLGLAVLAALTGCGGGTSGAVVSGKVTLAGAPLTGGTIVFEPLSGGGLAANSVIKADGTYEVKGVAIGDCKVTVATDYLRTTGEVPKLPGGAEAPPSSASLSGLKYMKIDAKYSKVATTDLKTTVVGPKHTYDIDLK